LPAVGVPKTESDAMSWQVDLSGIEGIHKILKEDTDYQFQFFFQVDWPSDEITIRFVGNQESPSDPQISELRIGSTNEFLQKAKSDTRITLDFAEDIITRAFPSSTSSVRWSSVHDGKEVALIGLTNLEIFGDAAKILAEPRYAWVLTFRDCHSVALRNLELGHIEPGYCSGGVIKFELRAFRFGNIRTGIR
jgi:hypothetical protein